MIQLVTTEEPPWARKGMAMPVSGMRPVTPPAMTNTWSATIEARPVASSLAEGVAQREPGPEAAGDEEPVEEQDRGEADEAELLAERWRG